MANEKPKSSNKDSACKNPWFEDPSRCKVGNIYIFKSNDSPLESRFEYHGLKDILIRPGLKGKAHEFYMLKPNGETYSLSFRFIEGYPIRGCFREVETNTQRGGTRRRRMRKATRLGRSRRNRK